MNRQIRHEMNWGTYMGGCSGAHGYYDDEDDDDDDGDQKWLVGVSGAGGWAACFSISSRCAQSLVAACLLK